MNSDWTLCCLCFGTLLGKALQYIFNKKMSVIIWLHLFCKQWNLGLLFQNDIFTFKQRRIWLQNMLIVACWMILVTHDYKMLFKMLSEYWKQSTDMCSNTSLTKFIVRWMELYYYENVCFLIFLKCCRRTWGIRLEIDTSALEPLKKQIVRHFCYSNVFNNHMTSITL